VASDLPKSITSSAALDHCSSDRNETKLTNQFQKIAISIAYDRFVASLKQMPCNGRAPLKRCPWPVSSDCRMRAVEAGTAARDQKKETQLAKRSFKHDALSRRAKNSIREWRDQIWLTVGDALG
jgi:hypothetical protein